MTLEEGSDVYRKQGPAHAGVRNAERYLCHARDESDPRMPSSSHASSEASKPEGRNARSAGSTSVDDWSRTETTALDDACTCRREERRVIPLS